MGCVKVLMAKGLTMALGLFWNDCVGLRWVMALLSVELVLWNEKNEIGFLKWEKWVGISGGICWLGKLWKLILKMENELITLCESRKINMRVELL